MLLNDETALLTINFLNKTPTLHRDVKFVFSPVVVVITPSLRDGGTARTAIHAVNPIEIRLGER